LGIFSFFSKFQPILPTIFSESRTSKKVGDFAASAMLLETIDLDLYTDVVSHENQSLGTLLFGTIEYDPQLNLYVPFDGIFGKFFFDNLNSGDGEIFDS
jgi:hypothetical protein